MRLISFVLFAFGLACAGGSQPEPTPATAPASTGAAAAPAATPAPDPDAALADHYLVILGSKLDPAEVIPGVETLRAHPEVSAKVRQVRSSRFKNLMPCYAVTIADATPDRKAAFALSKQLTALGVDNYVKNAGAWVGPSAAIDAYCAAGDAPLTEEVRVATRVDGALWLPVPTAEAELEDLRSRAPAPVAKGEGYDAWVQPLGAAEPARYRLVDAATGRTRTCRADEDAILWLGTPHFGALQGDGPPTEPQCGTPARYHRLACDEPVDTGHWVAVPEAATLAPYEPLGGAPGLEAAAKDALKRTVWAADPDGLLPEDGPVERTVTVTRWKGPAGEVALVEGRRAWGNGVCGGDDTLWFGVFGVNGDTLGAALGGLREASFAHVQGLVDIGADGRPDVVVTSFPETTTVYGGDGQPAATLAIDYCDCAC